MVIFYGFKTFTKEMLTSSQTCSTCGEKASVKLMRERRWFDLFWIPVIPVSTKYYHSCGNCNSMVPVTNEAAKAEIAGSKEAK